MNVIFPKLISDLIFASNLIANNTKQDKFEIATSKEIYEIDYLIRQIRMIFRDLNEILITDLYDVYNLLILARLSILISIIFILFFVTFFLYIPVINKIEV